MVSEDKCSWPSTERVQLQASVNLLSVVELAFFVDVSGIHLVAVNLELDPPLVL